MSTHRLADVAAHLQASIHGGDPDQIICGVAPIEHASEGQVTFLYDSAKLKHLAGCRAAAVVIPPKWVDQCLTACLVVEGDLKLAYARLVQLFEPKPSSLPSVHATAQIGNHCQLGKDVSIGAHAVIGEYVRIGDQVVICSGCVVGDKSEIDDHSHLYARVTLYPHVRIGQCVRVHSGAVIGKDGFGLAYDGKKWVRIAQLGGVSIGSDVEIGANTTVDCGALQDTIIESGVKIDNQVQIAHNVFIGAHTVIAGCVGIAGSTRIGRHCMIGGGACIGDHLTLADGVVITGMAMVTHSLSRAGVYSSGTGLLASHKWRRSVVRFRQLEKLFRRVTSLEKQNNGS